MTTASTIVLITGANSGVGYAIAKVLACASPTYHIFVSSRNIANAHSTVAEISKHADVKGTLSALQLDITDPTSVERAAQKVTAEHGRLDVLINNAGVASQDPDLKTNYTDTIVTNAVGPAIVAAAFNPLLVKSAAAYSIFVSSGLGSLLLAADSTNPHSVVAYTPYRMSKAALDMLVIQEAKDVGKKGVKVFAFCPGLVVSNLRGKSEEARNYGGALDPETSGQTILSILQGERDGDVGKFVHKDGIYPW